MANISPSAIAEQDFFLLFNPDGAKPDERQRQEFYAHDTHGRPCDPMNPVLAGKRGLGITLDMLWDSYFGGDWEGWNAVRFYTPWPFEQRWAQALESRFGGQR